MCVCCSRLHHVEWRCVIEGAATCVRGAWGVSLCSCVGLSRMTVCVCVGVYVRARFSSASISSRASCIVSCCVGMHSVALCCIGLGWFELDCEL